MKKGTYEDQIRIEELEYTRITAYIRKKMKKDSIFM